MMKWLTLKRIKQQLRIEEDFHDEDEILEEYGESAEEVLLTYVHRSYEELVELYGNIPAPLRQASLLLVDASYQHRSAVSMQNISPVPYAFDMLVKPYVRLAFDNEQDGNG